MSDAKVDGTGAAGQEPAASRELPRARWGREGYAADEVESFLAELDHALRHDPPTMAPYEVADQRFKVTRFGRGYALRAVDEHLAHAQAALRERHGADAVSDVEGRVVEDKHVSTLWIYLVGAVLVVAIAVFALTQL